MDKIVDLIATDSSASDISDLIKDSLFTKAAEKINTIQPDVANSLFNTNDSGDAE